MRSKRRSNGAPACELSGCNGQTRLIQRRPGGTQWCVASSAFPRPPSTTWWWCIRETHCTVVSTHIQRIRALSLRTPPEEHGQQVMGGVWHGILTLRWDLCTAGSFQQVQKLLRCSACSHTQNYSANWSWRAAQFKVPSLVRAAPFKRVLLADGLESDWNGIRSFDKWNHMIWTWVKLKVMHTANAEGSAQLKHLPQTSFVPWNLKIEWPPLTAYPDWGSKLQTKAQSSSALHVENGKRL